MEKIYRAIVLLATIWTSANSAIGAEITVDSVRKLHVVAVVNDRMFQGSAIADDNDSCRFFLADDTGKPVDIGNLDVSWLAQCHRSGHPELLVEYGLSYNSSFAAFRLKPQIWGVTFGNGCYLGSYGVWTTMSDTIAIVCRVSSGWEIVEHGVQLKLDVLPPTPTLKIKSIAYDETCIDGDDPFYSALVTIEYDGSDFDFAVSTIRDNGATPPTYADYDLFDSPDELPSTVSYYVYYGSSFLFQVTNDYGWSGTGWVTPDWEASTTSITNARVGGVNVSTGNGVCNISSDAPLGNVSVVGLGGNVYFAAVVNESNVSIPLTTGFYLLRIQKERDGKEFVRKILIN